MSDLPGFSSLRLCSPASYHNKARGTMHNQEEFLKDRKVNWRYQVSQRKFFPVCLKWKSYEKLVWVIFESSFPYFVLVTWNSGLYFRLWYFSEFGLSGFSLRLWLAAASVTHVCSCIGCAIKERTASAMWSYFHEFPNHPLLICFLYACSIFAKCFLPFFPRPTIWLLFGWKCVYWLGLNRTSEWGES